MWIYFLNKVLSLIWYTCIYICTLDPVSLTLSFILSTGMCSVTDHYTPAPNERGYTVIPLCVCLSLKGLSHFFQQCKCLKFSSNLCFRIIKTSSSCWLINDAFGVFFLLNFQLRFLGNYSSRCLKFYHTLCLGILCGGIHFCTYQTSTFC